MPAIKEQSDFAVLYRADGAFAIVPYELLHRLRFEAAGPPKPTYAFAPLLAVPAQVYAWAASKRVWKEDK